MKVAIMQPYFFPYLGYFCLIKNTDLFILLDNVQFIRHGWIERNRILNQKEGWIYIQIPILKKNGRDTIIKEILIDNSQSWKQKILSQLMVYKKISPNYDSVIDLMRSLFSAEYTDITSINKAALELVCDYLEIKGPIPVFSQMNIAIERPTAPDEWALNICKALGNVDEYWNLPGGLSFFDKSKYHNAGLKLEFIEPKLLPYEQKRPRFEPGLSIIDVLMFNSKDVVSEMLEKYELL